ncbi:MAG: preprotein translocase subunit YidC [Gammaproteobacteria bacterium]|nr:MAG: preprotein translocase subunit YidC [Gammaproteobacteria bacterium]
MDNQRLFLVISLTFVVLLLWQAWEQDYGARHAANPPAETAPVAAALPPQDVPAAQQPSTGAAATNQATPIEGSGEGLKSAGRIRVITDVYNIEIDTLGGDLREVDLRAYPVVVGQPDQPFRLMKDEPGRLFIAQTGMLSRAAAPDHHALYSAAQTEFRLADGADELTVPLTWVSDSGLKVTKSYTFRRGSYLIDIDHTVTNNTPQEWSGRIYRQLQRTRPGDGETPRFIYTYTGGVIYSDENKYKKFDFDDMAKENLSRDITGGWAAMIQHYFVGALVPTKDQTNHYYSKALADGRFVLGMVSPDISAAPGASVTHNTRLFVGPKLQHQLEEVAPGLELTVDYGILTILSKPLYWLLNYIHKVVNNWGWAIIILTLIIKLAFYKLSAASYKSMANMRKLAPKLQQLRERYGDDRQRMSQGMMDLYKKEKINPLGGCLPIMVQIPVFIALYWVLLESVELRQAGFIFWLNDLSTKDPYYVLPVIMGATMFFQQKLNPPPPDPVQAKVMMMLPFIFTAFFAFFPSGLVLYWVANSVLSIAQQWYITYRVEKMAAT